MKLFFPHYKELSTKEMLKPRHFQIMHALMCEKLNAINNNPDITMELIQEHLHLEESETSFYANEKTKDCITITFTFNLYELFDCRFEMPIYVHYDENGRQTHYSSNYEGGTSETGLIKHLNIDHFNDPSMTLNFYLDMEFGGSTYVLVKKNCFKTPDLIDKIKAKTYYSNSMCYFFDKEHKLCKKSFETKKVLEGRSSNYYVDDFGTPQSELLLVSFVNHVNSIKTDVDTSFLDYASIDFEDTHWFKSVNKIFYDNFNGPNKVAFMDYLKLIEMIEC